MSQMGETMSADSQPTADQKANIKLETVFPIQIREKDGALSLARPGETIKYETDPQTQMAMLATKINEVVVQLHRVQKVTFHNNKMIAHLDETNLRELSDIIHTAIENGEITHNAASIVEGKSNGDEKEPTNQKQ